MKNVIKVLGVAVKYASIITVIVEILNFAMDKLQPFTPDVNTNKEIK